MLRNTLSSCVSLVILFGLTPTKAQEPSYSPLTHYIQENLGQVKDQHGNPRPDVFVIGTAGQLGFHLRKCGMSYQLYHQGTGSNDKPEQIDNASNNLTIYRLDMNWLNCQGMNQFKLSDENPGYSNYYNVARGMEPALFVRDYRKLIAKNIWPGVDLHLSVQDEQVETDWYLEKAADLYHIQIEIKGAEISIEDGCLIMKTPFGEIREGKLKVLQGNKQLKAHWMLNNNIISFEVEGANPELPLIIDPPTRIWSSYYGGTGEEKISGSVVDKNENLIVGGNANSLNLTTYGIHQRNFGGGASGLFVGDGLVAKFNDKGIRIWATYYGGNQPDNVFSVTTDSSDNIYFVGRTRSDTGIASHGGHQTTYGGWLYDGFIVKLNTNGIRQWSSYIGGSSSDQSYSCAIDPDQNVYITGYSYSNTQIATPGAWQYDVGAIGSDAFLMKFTPGGTKIWGTYLGGSGMDQAYGCTTDDSGHVYLCGYADCISTMGYNSSHQDTNAGGFDAFLSKFDSSGALLWSTYYGGEAEDIAYSCKIGKEGNIYFVGTTLSDSNIASSGAFQNRRAGDQDLFIAKFDPGGQWLWGSYFGGNADEITDFNSLTLDRQGNIYFTGGSLSITGIASSGAYQMNNSGINDAFLVKFTRQGTRVWSTYYGGNGNDLGGALCTTSEDELYMTGSSSTQSGLATPGTLQYLNGGGTDGLLTKFRVIESNTISQDQFVCSGNEAHNLFGPSYSNAGFTYRWLKSVTDSLSGFYAAGGNDSSSTYSPGVIIQKTWYKRVLSQHSIHDTSNVVLLQPATFPTAHALLLDDSLCFGDSLRIFDLSNFNGDSALSLNWFWHDTLLGSGDTFSFLPATVGIDSIQLIVTSNKGCADTTSFSYHLFRIDHRKVLQSDSGALCPGDYRLLYSTIDPGLTFDWIHNGQSIKQGIDSSILVNDTGSYWINISSQEGCYALSDTLNLVYAELPELTLHSDESSLCQNTWIYVTDTTQSSPAYQRKWWLDGQLHGSTKSIHLQLTDTGEHWFVLRAETATGCSVSDSLSVMVISNPQIMGLNGVVTNTRIDSSYLYTSLAQTAQTYIWTLNEGHLISGQGTNQATINWNDTTKGGISLLVTSQEGCMDSTHYAVTMDLAPAIYQFSPQNGKQGDTISVEGVNFTRTTFVSVGGVMTQSYQIQDHRHLTAILGTGDDGKVRVETPYGNAELGTFNFQGVSARPIRKEQFRIYPNPVYNHLYIERIGSQQSIFFELYDANGRLIKSGEHSEGMVALDTEELSAGLYFLYIEGQRFTVEKY